MAEILSGREVADTLARRSLEIAAPLRQQHITPTLAVIRIGDRPGDLAYLRGAGKNCTAAGVELRSIALPQEVTQSELLQTVDQINRDPQIHGCLLLRPLPPQLDDREAREALSPEKDVDGLTTTSIAAVTVGEQHGFPPCTPRACMELLDHYGIELRGKRITVVGRSLVVGRPLALLLLNRDATVTVAHSRSRDLPALCREADIVVAAAGQAGLLGAECLRPGQTVLDVGVNYINGKMCGDVDPAAAEIVAARTPVPGGIGAVTSAVLARQVIEAALRASKPSRLQPDIPPKEEKR